MSFYMLELSIAPGDYTKQDFYIYNDLAKIRKRLEEDLESPFGCFLAIYYGENIRIHIYQDLHKVQTIDLHPHLTYSTETYPHIYFDPDGEPMAMNHDEEIVTKGEPEFDKYFNETINNATEDDEDDNRAYEEGIAIEVDFSTILPLEGYLIDRGDEFSIPDFGEIIFHYGHNDLEHNQDFAETDDEDGEDQHSVASNAMENENDSEDINEAEDVSEDDSEDADMLSSEEEE